MHTCSRAPDSNGRYLLHHLCGSAGLTPGTEPLHLAYRATAIKPLRACETVGNAAAMGKGNSIPITNSASTSHKPSPSEFLLHNFFFAGGSAAPRIKYKPPSFPVDTPYSPSLDPFLLPGTLSQDRTSSSVSTS